MSTIAAPPPTRLSDDEFERLCKLGAFGHRRVELIGGRVVEMNPTYTLHALTRRAIARGLEVALAAAALKLEVIEELSVKFGGGFFPMPDVLVWDLQRIDGPVLGAEARLVVEVADETLADDLGEKRAAYAAAGLPEYWVIDVRGQMIHQFAAPHDGAYDAARRHPYGARIESLTLPGAAVDTGDLPRV